MATNQQNDNIFAPPTKQELGGAAEDIFSTPPTEEEMGLFAPPTKLELGEKSTGAEVTDEDLAEIARKYGINKEDLKDVAPYYGAAIQTTGLGEAASAGAKYTAGFVGRSLGLGIPQFIYKKMQDEPTRKALDELNKLASEKRSYIESASELVAAPAAIPEALATTAARRIGTAAVIGGIAGTAGSEEGQELSSAATGATIGTGFGAGAELLGKVLTYAEKKVVQKAAKNRQFQADVGAGADKIASKRTISDVDIENTILRGRELSEEAASRIAKEQIPEETLQGLVDETTEEGKIYLDRVRREMPDEVASLGAERSAEQKLAGDLVETRARDFAEYLTKEYPASLDEAQRSIAEYADRQGAEAVTDKWKIFNRAIHEQEYIRSAGIHTTSDPGFWGKAANFISDAQFVLRGIDEKYRLGLEPIHHELNANYNRMTFAKKDFQENLNNILINAKKSGVDTVLVNTDRIYKALDSGEWEKLNPPEIEVAKQFQEYFKKSLDFVNGVVSEKEESIAPLAIPTRENYVPHQLVDTGELIQRFEAKRDAALEDASRLLKRPIQDIAEIDTREFKQLLAFSKNTRDLVHGLQVFGEKKITSPAYLSTRFKEQLYSRDGRISMETKARAVLERTGDVPEWMRETNLYKLADRWTTNTLRHLYLRKPIDQLAMKVKTLSSLGAEEDSRYISRLVQDLMGIRKGTAAESQLRNTLRFQLTMDKLIKQAGGKETVVGARLNAAKAIPEILSGISKQIYPNLLGMSIRAMIQNSTQIATKLYPELGLQYGMSNLLRSGASSVLNFRRQLARLEKIGLVPDAFNAKYREAVADGIRRTAPYSMTERTLQASADVSLFLYQKIESMNRAMTLSAADTLVWDLTNKNKLALDAIKKWPNSIRTKLQSELDAGLTDKATSTAAKYLNATTQFNYNRASMSEWGRTMGPLFSTFSKWPTATAGDIIQEFRNKGALHGMVRNAEKYLAPWMLLQAFDYILLHERPEEDNLSDRQKLLFGKSGLSQAAPIGNLESILKGDFFTPPMVDAVLKGLIIPAIQGDTGGLQKGIATTIQNFTPGAGYVRFITDDLPTIIQRERPEGSDFLERTQEGLHRIGR